MCCRSSVQAKDVWGEGAKREGTEEVKRERTNTRKRHTGKDIGEGNSRREMGVRKSRNKVKKCQKEKW